jgi:hypothetical protein
MVRNNIKLSSKLLETNIIGCIKIIHEKEFIFNLDFRCFNQDPEFISNRGINLEAILQNKGLGVIIMEV